MPKSQEIFASRTAQEARLGASIRAWYLLQSELVDTRVASGVTQKQLGEKLNITQPAVSVFESSNTLATQIGTIISYAAALGLEVEFSLKKTQYPDLPES